MKKAYYLRPLTFLYLEETKYYKTLAKNVTHFDNGPRVIRHPPPSVSFGEDLGMSVSWTCDAVAKGAVSYKWLKNDKVIDMLFCSIIVLLPILAQEICCFFFFYENQRKVSFYIADLISE